MKENIKTILFIASVALNLVFAATYFTYKLPSLFGVHQPAVPAGPLFLQLDLTPDQVTQFRTERDKFHTQQQQLGQQIKAKQIELIDLLGATTTDEHAIARKQEEIQRLQAVVQDRLIIHFFQESSLLNPEQRTRFFNLIKERIERNGQSCPPWTKPLGKGPGGVNCQ